RASRSGYALSVSELLFGREGKARKKIGNARPRQAVAINRIRLIVTMRELLLQCRPNFSMIVPNVHHVDAAVTPELSAADIDRRHAQDRRFANSRAGIADDAARPRHQGKKRLRRHVLEEVDMANFVLLAIGADWLAREISDGVHTL